MIEIKRVYRETLPAHRLIGKRYTEADREGGGFGAKWGEWFQKGWFEPLEKLGPLEGVENGYLGFMTHSDNEFAYWIGLFFAPGTEAPEGYEALDLPESDIGTCWIYGSEENGEIYGEEPCNMCGRMITENGWVVRTDLPCGSAFAERYQCPRFTQKDEHGKVTLDYFFYIK